MKTQSLCHNDTKRTHPGRENRTMNRLQRLFGRRARAAGGFTTETALARRRPSICTSIWGVALAAGLLAAAAPQAARAAVSENFDSIFNTSYGNQTGNGWRINLGLRSGTGRSGSCARTQSSGSANYLQYEGADGNGKDGGVGTISFWYRAWDQNPQPSFKVQVNVNGGGFTDISSVISPNTTYAQFSYDLNDSSDNIIVRIQQTAGERMLFDDAYISDYSAPTCSSFWHALYDRGAPLVTYYVGDSMGTNYEFAINQDTGGWTVEYGIGTSTDGSSWTWETATWSRMDGANNRVWKANSDEYQFTSAGTYYYAGRFTTGSCTYYADVDWEETSGGTLSAASYFTVSAINNPSGQDAATASSSQINLTWSLNAQSHDVMVVRSADSSFTDPTPGQAYSVSDTIGGDTVIYNGSGTSHNDTGRDASTTYYYKFYSVNNDYYSSGVTDSATTYGPPAVSTGTATPSTPADLTQANATGNVTADGGSTVTERGIVWQSNSGDPDTSDNKVPHASGGTGEFTVTLTGLTPGQTVYYRAYATNSTAVAYGTTLNFTADCFTNGPGILAASAVGSDTFTANWEAVAGASGYELDVMTDVGGGGGATDLFFSEYIEGSSNNKALEIYNGTGSSVDLSDYEVRLYSNGSATPSTTLSFTTETIANGAVFVIANSAANATILAAADITSGVANYNGDDAIALYKVSTSSFVDIFGEIGNDPGSSWTDGSHSTVEQTLVRKSSVSGGVTVNPTGFPTLASEWDTYSQDTATYLGDHTFSGGGGAPDYVDGYEAKELGAVTSCLVTGLATSVEYFYRVRATNDYCTSDNSETTNVTTIAGTPSVTLADNGTQIAAGNVAAGTTDHVLHTFSLAVSTANATLTGVSFTSAGTYAAADLDNFKVYYSEDNSLATTGDNTLLGTISTDLGTGTHSLSLLNQAIDAGDTGYIFITADIDTAAAAGKTVYISPAIDTDDVTFASANKSGSTTAGGAQTITAAVTISLHASSPAAGNLAAGTANAVLFGFTLTPASGSFDFTGLVVDIAGTADSGDLSGFEIVYDADGDGVFDGGESVVSDTKAIGATITFVMSGQTGLSAARSYLLIADVAAAPTAGRTITASVDTVDVTTTGTESGDADGAEQTIITAPSITTPTAADIAQTTATLGATLAANGGATVSDYGVVWNTAGTPTTSDNVVQEGTTEPGMPDVFTVGATSLSQGTKVYYRGYAINSVNTAYSAQGSFYTEPGQASGVTFANVTATGMRISWTAGADSDGAIVVVRAASAVADGPTDGTEHSASATFGSGANLGNSSYVVYRSTGTQVDVTGLTAGTTYHVAVYAYKGSGADSGADLGINYRQTSPATGSRATLAAEPTTHSSNLSFSNIGAYSMNLSWTAGNGARRIVVVKQGGAVSWAPTDGVAPSGVNGNYSLAGILSDGSRICYDGDGTSFALSGLDELTTYYVKIFEYNGMGTGVNYYTGGTPLSGSETTTAAACVPAQVVLLQREAYYTAWGSGGGIFNNSSDTNELGQWANTGNMQSVAWRTFKTAGNGTGDNRALQPGDRFDISLYGYSPYGILGVSLNDGAATGSWDNRHSNTRGYVQCGHEYGDLYVTGAGGASSWSGVRPWGTTLTIRFDVLSTKEFTANIVGQAPKSGLAMIGNPGDLDRIDGYSIYFLNGWNGSSHENAYWKQPTTITNLGYVEFGQGGVTQTIYGLITDGVDAHCPEVASPNYLLKSGGGNITLNRNNNTYSLYTDIAGGTLSISADGALGTAPASVSPQHLRISGAGAALVALDTFTLNANRGLTLSNWMYLGVADNKVLTYNGVITDGAGSYSIVKNQGGELILGGNSAYDGGTYIDAGTLTLNHANAAGTGGIYIGQDSGTLAATLNIGAEITVGNNVTIRAGSSGVKTLRAAETATLSGALAIAETGDDRFTIDVAR